MLPPYYYISPFNSYTATIVPPTSAAQPLNPRGPKQNVPKKIAGINILHDVEGCSIGGKRVLIL